MPKLAESRFVSGPRDELAVADVYEVTENAIRNRAETLLDELADLLGGIRLDFEEFIIEELGDLLNDLLGGIISAIKDMLAGLPSFFTDLISSGTVISGEALKVLLSDFPLIWDLGAFQLHVDPKDWEFTKSVDEYIRGRKNKLDQAISDASELNNGEGSLSNEIAQHLVTSRIAEELIRRDMADALPTLMETVSKDSIKASVAKTVLPVALNPRNVVLPPDSTTGQGTASSGLTTPTYVTSPRFENGTIGRSPDKTETGESSSSVTVDSTTAPIYQEDRVVERDDVLEDTVGIKTGVDGTVVSRPADQDGDYQNDLDVIEEVLGYIPKGVVRAEYPRLVMYILRGVYIPHGVNLETFYNRLIALLESIDPLWAYVERGENYVTNLNIFRKASFPSRTLFALFAEDDVRAASLIAPRIPFKRNRVLMKDQYPFATI